MCLASRLSQENTFTEITLKSPILRAPVSPRAVYLTTLGVSRKAFQQIWFLFETIFGSFVMCPVIHFSGKRMRIMDRWNSKCFKALLSSKFFHKFYVLMHNNTKNKYKFNIDT